MLNPQVSSSLAMDSLNSTGSVRTFASALNDGKFIHLLEQAELHPHDSPTILHTCTTLSERAEKLVQDGSDMHDEPGDLLSLVGVIDVVLQVHVPFFLGEETRA